MAGSFADTMRSLEKDRVTFSTSLAAILGALLVFATLGAAFYHIPISVSAVSGRLEVDGGEQGIYSAAQRHVITSTLAVGRTVEAGEVLLVLDDRDNRRHIEEASLQEAELELQLSEAEQSLGKAPGARDSVNPVSSRSVETRVDTLHQRLDRVRMSLKDLRREAEGLSVRSPVRGRLSNVGESKVGSLLRDGELVATVVPAAELHVVGEFSAAESAGRIAVGQRANVRLSAFQNSDGLRGHVTSVAPPFKELVQVAFALERTGHDEVSHLEHGMPARIDVELSRVSLLSLMLSGL